MINQATIDVLRAMRFSAMAAEFENQLKDTATYEQLGFEERFSLLVDAEWNRRQSNKLRKYIKAARFSVPGALLKALSTMLTENSTRLKSFVLLPAGTSKTVITSS